MDPLEQLARAVRDPGRNPAHHRMVTKAHRRQWPVLWEAIDRLLAEHDRQRCTTIEDDALDVERFNTYEGDPNDSF